VNRCELENFANRIVFTGMIDEFYCYKFGTLEYRSLKFEREILNKENHQGNAVVNYTEYKVPFMRIIECKNFQYGVQPKTVITKEYPAKWKKGDEPYYPINNEINNKVYNKNKELADKKTNVIFGGRLAEYKYCDMHNVIGQALKFLKKVKNT
jgi:UDP-galactopyranose mutase